MAFQLVEPRVETFYCFDDLIRFANEEAIRTIRLPLKGLLEQGAVVADDQGIGTGQTLYSLNTDSFKALCHLTGTTPDFLQGLQVEGLASAVLNDVLAVPIKVWDERLTSVQANRYLIEGNVRRDKRKEKVDQMAAAILLQSYLDAIA